MCYRRGFEHGARETFRAVADFLDPATRAVLRAWIDDVHAWRYEGMLELPADVAIGKIDKGRHR
jgi:hypothetical protein